MAVTCNGGCVCLARTVKNSSCGAVKARMRGGSADQQAGQAGRKSAALCTAHRDGMGATPKSASARKTAKLKRSYWIMSRKQLSIKPLQPYRIKLTNLWNTNLDIKHLPIAVTCCTAAFQTKSQENSGESSGEFFI